jgi:DNA-binding Xre family transcriptional regulator
MKFTLDNPEELKSRRCQLGMTVKDVANISRVDYKKLIDMERAKYKKIDAPMLEAVCYALKLHPMQVSSDYEPPASPRVTHVAVNGRMIADYLETMDMNAFELANKAGISHGFVYGPAAYDSQTLPAEAARKLAHAMGMRGQELAPALGVWPGPEGEEMSEFYGRDFSQYGAERAEDVVPLPK